MKRIRKRVPVWLNVSNTVDRNIYEWLESLSKSKTENLTETFRTAVKLVWAVKRRDWEYLCELVPEFAEWCENRALSKMQSHKDTVEEMKVALADVQKQLADIRTERQTRPSISKGVLINGVEYSHTDGRTNGV